MMKWHWQYLTPLLMIASSMDMVIMPVLESFEISGWRLFWITSLVSTAKLYIWYFFWKWFRKMAIPELVRHKLLQSGDIQEGLALGKEIERKLRGEGLAERIAEYCHYLYKKYTDEDSKLVKRIKRGGHLGMLMLGVLPNSIFRAAGVTCCATFGWHRGMYSLLIGNIGHIAYMVGVWDLIFSFFKN